MRVSEIDREAEGISGPGAVFESVVLEEVPGELVLGELAEMVLEAVLVALLATVAAGQEMLSNPRCNLPADLGSCYTFSVKW